METGNIQRAESFYELNRELAEKKPGDSAEEREQNALREKLANEAALRGTQRGAKSEFPATAERTGEEKIGYVRAGDEKDHADGTEEKQKRAARVTGNLRGERRDFGTEPASAVRNLFPFLGKYVHFRLRLGDGDAGLQARDDGKFVRGGGVCGNICDRGDPHFREARELEAAGHLFAARKRETIGHHADDGVGLAVQFESAADNAGIAGKFSLP